MDQRPFSHFTFTFSKLLLTVPWSPGPVLTAGSMGDPREMVPPLGACGVEGEKEGKQMLVLMNE